MKRLAALVVSAAVGAGACGSDAPETAAPPAVGPQHIHGLGINPADRSLLIATHTGLFRATAGSEKAERVSEKHQDTMGFTVTGPDRFLGSGHPDARDDLPPLLGLIESTDAGQTWKPISLLGEADFHALEASGGTVYGFDATHSRLMVSSDGGRRWTERTPPAPVIDLAIDPADAASVVASTEAGVFTSRDAGSTWRPRSRTHTGLLAWTSRALVLIDGTGAVYRSTAPDAAFERVGGIGGRPAALAADGSDLYAALHTNEVKLSTDHGASWRTRVSP